MHWWMNEWMNDCINERINERLNKLMSRLMNDRDTWFKQKYLDVEGVSFLVSWFKMLIIIRIDFSEKPGFLRSSLDRQRSGCGSGRSQNKDGSDREQEPPHDHRKARERFLWIYVAGERYFHSLLFIYLFIFLIELHLNSVFYSFCVLQ